ncbi:MAG: glycosyltransferase family 2 protein, partial [Desulfobacteraceae bacterium]
DQLSKAAGLDKYRIQSLIKIIDSGLLTPQQYKAAVMTLKQKSEVYAGGCRKRGRQDEAEYVSALAEKYRR